jgi:type IV secretory pathway TraG/TraD family ATPase VirD4
MKDSMVTLLILGGMLYVVVALVAGKGNAAKLGFSLIGALVTGLGKLSVLVFNGLRGGRWQVPALFGARSPVLAPGDASLPADRYQDYLDYRGVAEERELRVLARGAVSLGPYVHARGRRGRVLWLSAALLQRNCAVIGPPGSGKTEGIIIPWVLELLQQGYSVVTVDIKGDLIDRLGGAAQKLGRRLWYWNSADPSRSHSWNWLDGIHDMRDVEAAVQSILGRPKPNDPQPFFYERDYRWLRALIQITKAVYAQQAKPRDLYQLVGDQEALRDVFRRYPQTRSYATEVTDVLHFGPEEHSRAVSGLLNALHLFNTPSVIQVSERSDFFLPNLGVQPTLLIVGASLADARAAEVLSSMMLNQLFTFIYRRFGPSGTGTPLPVYFVLDEAARLKERLNFEEILSVARSAKVGICLAAQDVSQFGDERHVAAILTNCLTSIVLRGCSPETARYFAARLGQRFEQVVNVNRQRGPFDLFSQYGRGMQTVAVPVLREREIMHPPGGPYCAVVQVAPVTAKPFLVDLTRG